jgi:hypothetical protein
MCRHKMKNNYTYDKEGMACKRAEIWLGRFNLTSLLYTDEFCTEARKGRNLVFSPNGFSVYFFFVL